MITLLIAAAVLAWQNPGSLTIGGQAWYFEFSDQRPFAPWAADTTALTANINALLATCATPDTDACAAGFTAVYALPASQIPSNCFVLPSVVACNAPVVQDPNSGAWTSYNPSTAPDVLNINCADPTQSTTDTVTCLLGVNTPDPAPAQ